MREALTKAHDAFSENPQLRQLKNLNEKNLEIQKELADSNKRIEELTSLLYREHEARIEAQKANDLENKRANRLSVWALVVAIIALGCTIISAIFDVLGFFTR